MTNEPSVAPDLIKVESRRGHRRFLLQLKASAGLGFAAKTLLMFIQQKDEGYSLETCGHMARVIVTLALKDLPDHIRLEDVRAALEDVREGGSHV